MRDKGLGRGKSLGPPLIKRWFWAVGIGLILAFGVGQTMRTLAGASTSEPLPIEWSVQQKSKNANTTNASRKNYNISSTTIEGCTLVHVDKRVRVNAIKGYPKEAIVTISLNSVGQVEFHDWAASGPPDLAHRSPSLYLFGRDDHFDVKKGSIEQYINAIVPLQGTVEKLYYGGEMIVDQGDISSTDGVIELPYGASTGNALWLVNYINETCSGKARLKDG